uniref:Kinesin motor domain-containing protein n=1 Tax=Globisporangium ultimum (strain ATCC 200006 / CBS 805.95 / DAOM BR144) TaxID=431595 RepID=K3X103_GLOUD
MRLLDGEPPFDPLAMERAHVLIRLRDGDHGDAAHAHPGPVAQNESSPTRGSNNKSKAANGITRTSATTVRLEHSEMSPGVASITFEQVYDQEHSNADVFAQSIAPGVMKCVQGQSMSLVTTGAPRSGKSFTCHGDKQHKVTENEPEFKYQVLMNCMHVADDHLIDIMVNPPVVIHPPFSVERTLIERSLRAGNAAEAVHYYSQALSQSSQMTNNNTDFVFILHIETQKANDRVRRGRFICIDIHGRNERNTSNRYAGRSTSWITAICEFQWFR